MFARTPMQVMRREHRRLERATFGAEVPAGQVVVRQGTPAREFFFIEDGRADVIMDGARIATLGPGDFFGEIGLLQGGERTPSVVAATPMRLGVLPKREFVRLVRARARTAEALRQVALDRHPAVT